MPTDDDARAIGEPAGVDEVVASVAGLPDRPVDEHVAVFEAAHQELRRALDRTGPEGRSVGPA